MPSSQPRRCRPTRSPGRTSTSSGADSIDVASGPFKFVSWQKGTQLVLAKNTAFNAGPKAKVDRVIFRYIPSTPSLFQALQLGRDPGDGAAAAAPDRGHPEELEVQGPVRPRLLLGAHGHPVRAEGTSGAEAGVSSARPSSRASTATRSSRRCTSRLAWSRTRRTCPCCRATSSSPSSRTTSPNWKKWSFSQKKVIAMLKAKGCTGGPNTPSANNNDDLVAARASASCRSASRRQRQPDPRADVRDRQKQLKSVGIELVRGSARRAPSSDRCFPRATGTSSCSRGSVAPTSSATSSPLRLRWRPERHELLQQEGVRTAAQGAVHA